jgi:hypothetical protein
LERINEKNPLLPCAFVGLFTNVSGVVYFFCNINNGSLFLKSVGIAYNCDHPKNLIFRYAMENNKKKIL